MHDTLYKIPESTWSPLENKFQLRRSTIHGLGLFAEVFIPAETSLGITHVYTKEPIIRTMFPDGWIRSGTGAWYNHSADRPNCESVHLGSPQHPVAGDTKTLKTIRDIEPGEEILVTYTLYTPSVKT